MKASSNVFAYSPVIHSWIRSHHEELLDILKTLVKYPTVREQSIPGAPYGKACANGLEAVASLYRAYGFVPHLDSDAGYLLVETGTGARTIGLFSHGDVVAPGENWLYTEPFVPVEKDGFLIGRGVLDDKAAIVISLACARMLTDLDFPFNAKLLCYTGFNEESGMQDIRAYLRKHIPPDFGIVCDTAFPLYRGNKGLMYLHAEADTPFDDILDISGGEALNITLGKADAVLRYSESQYCWLKEQQTPDLTVERDDYTICLHATGISCHGALPQGSRNAGGMIAALLMDCPFLSISDRKKLRFMNELLNEYDGKTLGIQNTDPVFGPLTCINGIIRTTNSRPALDFNIRYGNTITPEKIAERSMTIFTEKGWSVQIERAEKAHLTHDDNPYIRTCIDIYRTFTGDITAKTQINAGGTYAMHLPCAAEIGPMFYKPIPFPLPQGHGSVHQPDECISLEGMMEALEVTMLMVLGCGNMGEG